jgi:hypothetical protein
MKLSSLKVGQTIKADTGDVLDYHNPDFYFKPDAMRKIPSNTIEAWLKYAVGMAHKQIRQAVRDQLAKDPEAKVFLK